MGLEFESESTSEQILSELKNLAVAIKDLTGGASDFKKASKAKAGVESDEDSEKKANLESENKSLKAELEEFKAKERTVRINKLAKELIKVGLLKEDDEEDKKKELSELSNDTLNGIELNVKDLSQKLEEESVEEPEEEESAEADAEEDLKTSKQTLSKTSRQELSADYAKKCDNAFLLEMQGNINKSRGGM